MRILFIFFFFLFSQLWSQKELFDLARKYAKEGKKELAEGIYENLYAQNRDSPLGRRALLELAELKSSESKEEALELVQPLLEEGVEDSIASDAYLLAERLLTSKEEKAKLLIRYANIFLKGEKRKEFLERAMIYLDELGKRKKALEVLKILSSEYPEERVSYQIQIAKKRWELGDKGRAKLILMRWVKEKAARDKLVDFFLEEGDTGEALYYLRQYDKFSSKRLASLYIDIGSLERAKEVLPKEESLDVLKLKERLFLKGDYLDSLYYLAQKIKDWDMLAEYYIRKGIKDSLSKIIQNIEDPLIRVRALISLGKLEEAYQILIGKEGHEKVKLELSKLLSEEGKYEEAYSLIEDITEFFPKESLLIQKIEICDLLGIEAQADINAIKKWGCYPIRRENKRVLLSLLKDVAFGRKTRIGLLRKLFQEEKYLDVLELMEGSSQLGEEEKKILRRAFVRAFLLKRNPYFLEKAKELYKEAKEVDIDFVRLAILDTSVSLPQFSAEGDSFLYFLSILYEKKGKIDKSREVIRKIQDRELRKKALFKFYLSLGLPDSAYIFLDEKDFEGVLSLSEIFFEKKAYDVVALLLEYIPFSNFYLSKEARLLQIRALVKLGRWDEAIRLAKRSLKFYPGLSKSKEFRVALAKAYLRSGNLHEAYRWATGTGSFEEKRICLSLGYLNEIKLEEEEMRWEELFRAKDKEGLLSLPLPQRRWNARRLLNFLSESGDTLNTLRLTRIFSRKGYIEEDESNKFIAIAYAKNGKDEISLSYARKLGDKERAEVLYELGIFRMRRAEFEQAKSYFIQCIDLDREGKGANAAFKLGSILYQENRFGEALEYYRIALRSLKDKNLRRDCLFNIALSFKKLKEPDSSILYFRRLAEEYRDNEESINALFSLAIYLIDLGRPGEAIDILRDLEGELKEIEDEAELKYWKGECYLEMGRIKEAKKEFQKVYTFFERPSTWIATALLKNAQLNEAEGRIKEAKALYRRVIDSRGEKDPLGKMALEALRRL